MPSPSAQTASARSRMFSLPDRLAGASLAGGHGSIDGGFAISGLPRCADALFASIHASIHSNLVRTTLALWIMAQHSFWGNWPCANKQAGDGRLREPAQ